MFTGDLFPVCAPAVAKRLGVPGDLEKATILRVTNAAEDWPLWLEAVGVSDAKLKHARYFDYAAFALQAAVDGLGVAMARAPFVADDLAAGRLVRPFKKAVPKGKGWYLVYRPAQENNPALRVFRDWLIGAATA